MLDVRPSHGDSCIELDFGHVLICKPKRLIFESFDFDEEWNYFRLECDRLEPSSYYPESLNRESLTELQPLLYTDANCSEYNDFNGIELPEGARSVDRILFECSFVFFRKTSTYNKIPSTYDARHNKMTTDEFRNYIEEGAKKLSEKSKINEKHAKRINLIRPDKYRTKNKILTEPEIQLIKKTISLAVIRDAESIEIDKNYYTENGLSTRNKDLFQYIEPRPKEKDLEDFLKNLSKDQLVLIAAVMYGGRDGAPPWGIPLECND